jgi:hypothetical protein
MIETSVMVQVVATPKKKHVACQPARATEFVKLGKQRGREKRFSEVAARPGVQFWQPSGSFWVVLAPALPAEDVSQ